MEQWLYGGLILLVGVVLAILFDKGDGGPRGGDYEDDVPGYEADWGNGA